MGSDRRGQNFRNDRGQSYRNRQLTQEGIKNTVVEPATLGERRGRGRRPKTDKLDAKALVALLVSAERGEPKVWRVVRVPSAEAEDRRRGQRHRGLLVSDRNRHTNRIRSKLLTVGVQLERKAFGRLTAGHLRTLKQWDGAPLPAELLRELIWELHRLELVKAQLKEIEEHMKSTISLDPLSQALMRLKGVGEKTAYVLTTELFSWRKFDNARQVGALAGLVGTPFRSGKLAHDCGISKAGNRRVRSTAVELAWFWVRYQPTSAITEWYQKRVGAKPTSRQKRVAIVAVARKLLVALWRYLKDNTPPPGAVIKTVKPKSTKRAPKASATAA